MRIPLLILVIVPAWSATVVGCGPSQVRQDAAVLAASTGQLNNEIEALTRSRRQIEAVRTRLTDGMDLSTARAESFNQGTLAEWAALKDDKSFKARSELFEGVRSNAEAATSLDAALATLAAKAAESSVAAKGTRSEQLAAAAKSLAALSRERSVTDEVKFLQGYVKAVQADLKKAKEDAQAAKDAATKKADALAARKKAIAPPISRPATQSATGPATRP